MSTKRTVPVYSVILIICFYLSLIRGTGIGLFYPADELKLAQIDYTFIKYMNYALLAGVIGYLFTANSYRLLLDKILSPSVLIFLCICITSIIFSVDKTQSVKYAIALTVISLPSVLYIYQYGSDHFLNEVSRFIILLSIASLLYLIVLPQYGIMAGKHAGAWRGFFDHKNGSGAFFAIGFYILLSRVQCRKSNMVIPLLSGIAICFLFVIFSKSTSAIIVFITTGLFYTGIQAIYRFNKAGERLGLFLAFFSMMFLTIFFGMNKFNDIIHQTTGKDATLSGRTAIWAPLMDMSYDRPLYGYGLGMAQRPEFMQRIHKYLDFKPKSTHNSYLDVILGIGYPGFALFLFLVLKTLFTNLSGQIYTLSHLRNNALFMSIILSLFIVSFASSFVLLARSFSWACFLACLVCLTLPQERNENESEKCGSTQKNQTSV